MPDTSRRGVRQEETEEERIARTYRSSMDSVYVINTTEADYSDGSAEKNYDVIKRNVDHLSLIVAKDFWTTEDLTPFTDAIESGNSKMALLEPHISE